MIRQNNAELEELRNQYENLDICEEDKQVIDDYICLLYTSGNIMLGFAILMTGMQTMSGAVSPLKDSPTFTNMLTMFSNPLIGILVGIAFTRCV